MRIVIFRGLPGSGKSTVAHCLSQKTGAVLIEQDQFRVRNGKYVFKSEDKVKDAFLATIGAYAQFGADIILTGVFATKKSVNEVLSHIYKMKPYDEDIFVKAIVCTAMYGSVHKVPESVIEQMARSWEPLRFEETLENFVNKVAY